MRTWRKWKCLRTTKDVRHTGRPSKCTGEDELSLCKFARANRFASFKKCAEHCRVERGVHVGIDTVSRILKRYGLSRRVAAKKPLLSKNAIKKRFAWAQNHLEWPFWKWRTVIFSDEKIFRTANNRRTVLVTRKCGEKFSKSCIAPTLKNAVQIHCWGAIGWRGVGPLKQVGGNLNAIKYQTEIIQDLQEVAQRIVPPRNRPIFQHDRAPAHNARSTHEFLEARRIQELDWPGNSPDQNIIENLWATVSHKVNMHPRLPANSAELWERVHTAWESITVQEVQKLYRSIPSRLQELVNAKGGQTHY